MSAIEFDDSLGGRVLFLNRQAEAMCAEGAFQAAKDSLFSAHRLVDGMPALNQDKTVLLAMTLHNLGCLHTRCKEHRKAVMFLEAAARLEKATFRPSAVTLLNLATARFALDDFSHSKEAAAEALELAIGEQRSVLPLAYLQLARLEATSAFHLPRAWERSDQAQRALDLFHQAVSSAPKDSVASQQALAELKEARNKFQKAGMMKHVPAPPPIKPSQVPTLPKIKKPAPPSSKNPYSTREARNVRDSVASRLPAIAAPKMAPTKPTAPQDHSRTARPALVAPVLWTCSRFMGLQTLLGAAEKKRKPTPGLRAVYGLLRTDEPLMPRFTLKTKSAAKETAQRLPVGKSLSPALAKALQLLQDLNEAPLRRKFFRLWVKALPQVRRSKPMRRIAIHMALRSAEVHRRDRWNAWLGKLTPKPVVANTEAACSTTQPASEPEQAWSPFEELVNRWVGKITSATRDVDNDRAKYDENTVQDDVRKLNGLKLDFASSLSTCYEKHRDVPVVDLPRLESKLENFMTLLLNDAFEYDETVTLFSSMFMNIKQVDFKRLCNDNKFVHQCSEDGMLRYMTILLEVFDEPVDEWLDVLNHGLYDSSHRIPLVEIVLRHPVAFPVHRMIKDLAPHWEAFVADLCRTQTSSEAGFDRRLDVLRAVLKHDGIAIDIHKEGDDECDILNRAAKEADLPLVKMLVDDVHIPIDSRMSTGMTPLMQAVVSDAFSVVEFLLHRNAARILYNGMTPLQIAKKLGQDARIVELLEDFDVEGGATALAVRKSFVATPVDHQADSADDDVEAFTSHELGVSPPVDHAKNDGDLLDGSFSSADTEEVEAQMRNEVIDELCQSAPPLDDLEVAPSDAPRRRLMWSADRGLFVADRVNHDLSRVSISRLKTGFVVLTVNGHEIVTSDVESTEVAVALTFELVVLDNGHVAFAAHELEGKLIEPDLSLDDSRVRAVADDEATNFSEFILTSRQKGAEDQTYLDALKLARRDTDSAKERRRKEKQRNQRFKVVRQFFTDQYAVKSFSVGTVDEASLLLTFDNLSSPNLQARADKEPLAQYFIIEVDDDGYVTFALREAAHLHLSDLEGEVVLAPETGCKWEVIELADGNMALESLAHRGKLVEVRLDLERHSLVLVPDDQSSSFCELIVRDMVDRDRPLPGTDDRVGKMSEDSAAVKIQCLHRKRQATKRVEALRNAKLADARQIEEEARPAGAQEAIDDAATDAAAIKIQSLHRGRAARKRTEELRRSRTAVKEALPQRHLLTISDARLPLLSLCGQLLIQSTGPIPLDEATAATKIQCLQRRRQAKAEARRRREARTEGSDTVRKPELESGNLHRPPNDPEAAAIKIQSLQRQRLATQEVDRRRAAGHRFALVLQGANWADSSRHPMIAAMCRAAKMKLGADTSDSSTSRPPARNEENAALNVQPLQRQTETERRRSAGLVTRSAGASIVGSILQCRDWADASRFVYIAAAQQAAEQRNVNGWMRDREVGVLQRSFRTTLARLEYVRRVAAVTAEVNRRCSEEGSIDV